MEKHSRVFLTDFGSACTLPSAVTHRRNAPRTVLAQSPTLRALPPLSLPKFTSRLDMQLLGEGVMVDFAGLVLHVGTQGCAVSL